MLTLLWGLHKIKDAKNLAVSDTLLVLEKDVKFGFLLLLSFSRVTVFFKRELEQSFRDGRTLPSNGQRGLTTVNGLQFTDTVKGCWEGCQLLPGPVEKTTQVFGWLKFSVFCFLHKFYLSCSSCISCFSCLKVKYTFNKTAVNFEGKFSLDI